MSDLGALLRKLRARARKTIRELAKQKGVELSVTAEDVMQSVQRRLLSSGKPVSPRFVATVFNNWFRDRYRRNRVHKSVGWDSAAQDRHHLSPGPDKNELWNQVVDFKRGDGPMAERVPNPETRTRMVGILWMHVVDGESERTIATELGISRRQVHTELTFMIAMLRAGIASGWEESQQEEESQ